MLLKSPYTAQIARVKKLKHNRKGSDEDPSFRSECLSMFLQGDSWVAGSTTRQELNNLANRTLRNAITVPQSVKIHLSGTSACKQAAFDDP